LGWQFAACVVAPKTVDIDDVIRVARERLAAHKLPQIVERRESLPRTPNGKVAKRSLRDELVRREARSGADPDHDQALIQAIWEDILNLTVPGIDQSFFSLGGDSLSALRVVSRIQDELANDVAVDELLAAPTIAEQAAVVAAARPEGSLS
jgi:hypothetical protein